MEHMSEHTGLSAPINSLSLLPVQTQFDFWSNQQLNKVTVGCYLNGKVIHHLYSADGLVKSVKTTSM